MKKSNKKVVRQLLTHFNLSNGNKLIRLRIKREVVKIFFFSGLCLVLSCYPIFSNAQDIEKEMDDKYMHLAKMLMDKEAVKSSLQLFNATFDPQDSKLIGLKEIHKFLDEEKVVVNMLPDQIQKALRNDKLIVLLVSLQRIPGSPKMWEGSERKLFFYHGNSGLYEKVSYDFWVGGLQRSGADGCNGEYWVYCSGCWGMTDRGTYSVCCCTNSCIAERECPHCGGSGGTRELY
ncbi:MAG TPA: hypothetical protein PKZ42_04125 [Syntrophales bacterium]|nr:hypothetical protein [Syntrophales bacterium]